MENVVSAVLEDAVEIIKRIIKPFVPNNLINEELAGIYGKSVLAEIQELIKYYNIYENGANFPRKADDYTPSDLRFKKIRMMVDKEARFMFANPLDIRIKAVKVEELRNENISNMQRYIDEVLKLNHFDSAINKGCKDCLIAKRIGIVCNFNEEYGITISFFNALGFIYDSDEYGRLNKFIAFESLNDSDNANEQRIKKKKYWLENGFCHVSENIYDGAGNLIENILEETTLFDYIPAVVILNDGLTGDMKGESEVANLFYYEQYYSKMSNLDFDSEKQGMHPIVWTRDMHPNSTKKLSRAPAAYWDLQSNKIEYDGTTGDIGMLEPSLSYSGALDNSLGRIKDTMYEQLDMPMVTADDLKNIVSSGKTLKAIYWGLQVRCDEKMLVWKDNLGFLIKILIDGAKLYPNVAERYLNGNTFVDIDYTVEIENNYALPEDTESEKAVDLSEVQQKCRSIKSYMRKYRPELTDEEIDEEIIQIARERQILEESYFTVANPNENQNIFEDSGNADDNV